MRLGGAGDYVVDVNSLPLCISPAAHVNEQNND